MKKRILITALSLQLLSFYHINSMGILLEAALQCIPAPKISPNKNPLGALLQTVEDPEKHKDSTVNNLISLITIRCNPEQTLRHLKTAHIEAENILHELGKQEMRSFNQDSRLHTAFGYVCIVSGTVAGTIPLNMTQKIIRGVLPPEYDNLATIGTWTTIAIGTFLLAKKELEHKNQNKKYKDSSKTYENLLFNLAHYQNQLFLANPSFVRKHPQHYQKIQSILGISSTGANP